MRAYKNGLLDEREYTFPCVILAYMGSEPVSADFKNYRIQARLYRTKPLPDDEMPPATQHSVVAESPEQAMGIIESVYRRGETKFRAIEGS